MIVFMFSHKYSHIVCYYYHQLVALQLKPRTENVELLDHIIHSSNYKRGKNWVHSHLKVKGILLTVLYLFKKNYR